MNTPSIRVVVTLALGFVLAGAFTVRARLFAQQGSQLPEAALAPDVTSTQGVSEDGVPQGGTHSYLHSGPPNGGRPKMTRAPIPRKGKASPGVSKGGGGGKVAVITFLVLFGLWCIRGWWITRRAMLHRRPIPRQLEFR